MLGAKNTSHIIYGDGTALPFLSFSPETVLGFVRLVAHSFAISCASPQKCAPGLRDMVGGNT